MEIADVAAAFLAVLGLLLIFNRLSRRPDLRERLAPDRPRSIADEAQEWLKRHH